MTADSRELRFEVCIDSVAGAIAAEEGGAHRVELCGNLVEGGTTPSAGMIRSVKRATSLPVMVMVRPRGGHFCYDKTEIDTLQAEAEAVLAEDPFGIVCGALRPDGRIDLPTTAKIVELSRDKSFTFHRAFDQVLDPLTALEQLVDLSVNRILTSGLASSVWTGRTRIRELVGAARGRISIMPGGGVRASNIRPLISQTGVHEVHFSGGQVMDFPVEFWRDDVPMSSASTPGDMRRRVTVTTQVREICQAALGDDCESEVP